MSLGLGGDKRIEDGQRRDDEAASFIQLQDGLITLRNPKTASSVASAPRCALTDEGDLVCTFVVQSELGINDFTPILSRSQDDGVTWREQGLLWPHLQSKYSIFGSISSAPNGELFFYGISIPIDEPGETFWSEATQGMKANSLVWARSVDAGRNWSEPMSIPLPLTGSAEAPGPLCVTRDGTWHVCYAPYNTFDPSLVVPRNQVVLMCSRDQGRTWRHTAMLKFRDELSTGAEAWVVELADGRLIGACWNMNQRDGNDYPNAFALSHDDGIIWSATQSTGIMGQSCALTPLADGSVLFVYNQRKHGRIGVWLAHARPTVHGFNVLSNELVWSAPAAPSTNGHSEWTQFTFGEPSATVLGDGTILVTFWTLEEGRGAIRYVRLTVRNSMPAPHIPLS